MILDNVLTSDPAGRVFICGLEQLDLYESQDVTHIVRISNPGVTLELPPWFHGEILCLHFGDVISRKDAQELKTLPPTVDDIVKVIEFTARAWSEANSRVLFHCDYGASRSPAMAFVALAQAMGAGSERRALQMVMDIRPEAMPNQYVVSLGDIILNRSGDLLRALKSYKDIEVDAFFNEYLGTTR